MSKKLRRYNVFNVTDPTTGKNLRVVIRKPRPAMSREQLYQLVERFHPEHRHHLIREVKPLHSLSIDVVCTCGKEFSITIVQQITGGVEPKGTIKRAIATGAHQVLSAIEASSKQKSAAGR